MLGKPPKQAAADRKVSIRTLRRNDGKPGWPRGIFSSGVRGPGKRKTYLDEVPIAFQKELAGQLELQAKVSLNAQKFHLQLLLEVIAHHHINKTNLEKMHAAIGSAEDSLQLDQVMQRFRIFAERAGIVARRQWRKNNPDKARIFDEEMAEILARLESLHHFSSTRH